ncbi:MAG: tRNA epoxyqueuosine(34) reductase QueG [Rikenellaceae bacterium]
MINHNYIKQFATEVGFDLCGVTTPCEFDLNRTMLERWIAEGNADSLSYMKQYLDIRFNPANLLENTESIVVCAVNYKNCYSTLQVDANYPQIASYAFARDYHKTIRKQLKELLRRLQVVDPSLRGRCCVDTAPLLEKQLAVEAGLGWIGRQSLLVTPQFGTFVLLGVLLLTSKVDHYDSPFTRMECGSCSLCVDNCPAGAILDNKMIDSRRCISALTVECDNPNDKELFGWLFGCDECQRCCPHNQTTPLATNSAFTPLFRPKSDCEWQAMTQNEFDDLLKSTPLKRGGLQRLQRNIKR